MATRVLRAGYFWPTIEADCQDHLKKCKPCQKHGMGIGEKGSRMSIHYPLSEWPWG